MDAVKLPPVLVYTVLRLLAFLVPFGLLMLLPVFQSMYWLAAIFAALIGLSLSILFLRRPLADASAQVLHRRDRAKSATVSDEDIEDAVSDAAPEAAASSPSRDS